MRYLLFSALLALIVSCDSESIFEENRDMESASWPEVEVQSFQFEIPDRNDKYDLFVNLRNTLSYPYSNIYIRYWIKFENGDLVEEQLVNFDLFDNTGKPMGSGLGDIFDHQLPLLTQYSFEEPGEYTIDLRQYMRQDTLDHVLSVGFRVESSPLQASDEIQ